MITLHIDNTSLKDLALAEIAQKSSTRKDLAKTMALIIRNGNMPQEDVKEIMTAALARWSQSGVDYILKLAWSGKAFE